jgi:hypothetical protein
MIDEADTALHRNDELRGILNSGYKRKTAYVVRVAMEAWKRDGSQPKSQRVAEGGMERQDHGGGEEKSGEREWQAGRGRRSRLVRYSSWCPKAIATIKHLPETL